MKEVTSSKKMGIKIVYTLIVGSIGFAGYKLLVGKSQIKTDTKGSTIPTKENPLKTFLINNERDSVLIFDSGSQIEIKKGSLLLDENKKPIFGSVRLKYREFSNF